MIINIPRKILSQNKWERMHYSARREEKIVWVKELIVIKCNQRLKKATQRRRVKITVGLKRLYDRDNISIKAVLDGLTKTGLIVDDSEEWIELDQTRQVKSKEPYVEIVISDMVSNGHKSLEAEFLKSEGAR